MTKAGIAAQAFGVPETIRSNQWIARMASRKFRQLDGASVYTQLDVCVDPGVPVEYTEEVPGKPPPTLRFCRGAVYWAMRLGLDELWIACAKPHLWRCKRDLERAILEAGVKISVRICEEVEQYPEDEWFCFDSTQERTRSREAWNKRERIIKLMPFWLYKFVAS